MSEKIEKKRFSLKERTQIVRAQAKEENDRKRAVIKNGPANEVSKADETPDTVESAPFTAQEAAQKERSRIASLISQFPNQEELEDPNIIVPGKENEVAEPAYTTAAEETPTVVGPETIEPDETMVREVWRLRKELSELEHRVAHPVPGMRKEDLEREVLSREERLRALEPIAKKDKALLKNQRPETSPNQIGSLRDKIKNLERAVKHAGGDKGADLEKEILTLEEELRADERKATGKVLETAKTAREVVAAPLPSPEAPAKEVIATQPETPVVKPEIAPITAEAAADRLAKRSEALNQSAEEKLSPEGASFVRKIGEKYNKLPMTYKVITGLALGGGAMAAAGFGAPAALYYACATGVLSQRGFGSLGMFVKLQDYIKNIAEGTATDRLGRQLWMKKFIEGRSENTRQAMAGVLAITFAFGTGYAARKIIEYGSDALRDWLCATHYMPHSTGMGARVATPEPGPMSRNIEVPYVSVDASRGRGYEYALKRLYEQMHSNNFSDYPEGSDASRLLHADAQTIDRVIHQIASDQQHDFFNADGTSVQVNPGTHFEIGMDGQVHMTDAAHHVSETVHAPIGAHTTPPYPPQTHVEVPHPVESIETPLEETPVTLPVEDVTSAQAEVPVPTSEEIETPITDTVPRGTVSADGTDAIQQSSTEAIIHENIQNKFGIEVSPTVPHIYADAGGKQFFVYGGSPEERARLIGKYFDDPAHARHLVFNADNTNIEYRIPYFKGPDGEVTVGHPIRTKGFMGFFKSFMKPPVPDEFRKIVQ